MDAVSDLSVFGDSVAFNELLGDAAEIFFSYRDSYLIITETHLVIMIILIF